VPRVGGHLNPLNQFTPYSATMNPARLLNPFNVLRRLAVYRGLLGGNKSWLVIGAVVWGPRLLRRAMGRRPERVAVEPMGIGHVLRIELLPQDTKLQRKAFQRTK
jgi:hypothetical protein